jgi:Domain of unknown function (DUF5666)
MHARGMFGYFRWMTTTAALGLAILLIACGGGTTPQASSPMPNPPLASGSSTVLNVNIGDSPSDRVIAFELTINSLILTRNDNTTVTVLSTPRRVEVTHLAGTTEPLVLSVVVPQGTYTSAAITVSAPEVVFIDNSGRKVEKEDPSFNKTITLNLNPPLVAGANPLVLTLDANVAASVSIDLVTGNVTINPVFTLTSLPLPAAEHEDEEKPENGELEDIVGQVTNVSATSFTVKAGQSGVMLTFNVNSLTKFEEVGGLSAIPVNALVKVEGVTQSDGKLLATEVELLEMEGIDTEGLITATTGNPVSSFTLIVHDGSGDAMNSAMLGSSVTVNVDSRTTFAVNSGDIDLSGLTLPAFSASSLTKGQRVEAETESTSMSSATLNAKSVKLEQQALTGAVSGVSGGQFTLTVADDSAFKLLTGKSTIAVQTQKNTEIKDVNLANSLTVRVRGLLFFDPSRANYVMVAARVTNP